MLHDVTPDPFDFLATVRHGRFPACDMLIGCLCKTYIDLHTLTYTSFCHFSIRGLEEEVNSCCMGLYSPRCCTFARRNLSFFLSTKNQSLHNQPLQFTRNYYTHQQQTMSSDKTMKALYLTRSPETSIPELSSTTVPIPTPPPGNLLIKVHYSSIQPSDKLNARGGFPKTTFPRIPGRDYAGVVVGGTPTRSDIKIGTEVYGSSANALGFDCDGVHAEYVVIPEHVLVAKPKNLSLLQAATVGVPFLTALLTLRRARATKDDIVLVLGASGGVGSSAIQIAKAIGCKRVLGAARSGSPDDTDRVILGASPADSFRDAIPKLTSGHGVDVIIDAVGNMELMAAAYSHLAIRGRYAWIASPRGPGAKTDFTFDIFQAYRKEIELVGCNTGNNTLEEVADELCQLKEWFESGALTTRGEDSLELVDLEDSIEKGYKSTSKKQVIIKMP